jgi:hypothetical protein
MFESGYGLKHPGSATLQHILEHVIFFSCLNAFKSAQDFTKRLFKNVKYYFFNNIFDLPKLILKKSITLMEWIGAWGKTLQYVCQIVSTTSRQASGSVHEVSRES